MEPGPAALKSKAARRVEGAGPSPARGVEGVSGWVSVHAWCVTHVATLQAGKREGEASWVSAER